MRKKRIASIALAAAFLLPSLTALSGCAGDGDDVLVLRIYNWEEYIDEGEEGAFIYDQLHLTEPLVNDDGDYVDEDGNLVDKPVYAPVESALIDDDYRAWYEETMGEKLSEDGPAVLDDFELWYEKTYGQAIRVEYATFGTNEDMYNELVLGNEYDLLCPSDYMIMKLAAEGRIEPYSADFFRTEGEGSEHNYYAKYVSPYIKGVFENGKVGVVNDEGEKESHSWSEYAAGYMWGTTGFMYNPDPMGDGSVDVLDELENSEDYAGWGAFVNPLFKNRITTKDNVRDTYFAALGLTYQNELLALSKENYGAALTAIFNRTAEEYIPAVRDTLLEMKKNIYGFETDTGKADMVSGKIWLNYAWSGDAVYSMSLAEDEDGLELGYYVPQAGSNLWFDGWVMTKGIEERGLKEAAEAFVNFLAMPQNAVRNSYYIGYTSVIAGEDMLAYIDDSYGEEPSEDTVKYDLSYFFGDTAEAPFIYAYEEDTLHGMLFAQYPYEEVIERCAVMDYFDPDTNERINELWSQVKAETLDAWAIAVICVAAAAIVLFVVFVKFGNKIDFFRRKPKKGYELVRQDPV